MKLVDIGHGIYVDLPSVPSFIVHARGRNKEPVPVWMFTKLELKKIGKAWTEQLMSRSNEIKYGPCKNVEDL